MQTENRTQTNLSNTLQSVGILTGAFNMATNFIIYAAMNRYFLLAFCTLATT